MALSIRIAGAGGMFLSQILLARSLGVSGYGEYAIAITWLQFWTVVAKLGLDNTSLRYVSEYVTKHDVEKLSEFTQDSTRASLSASLMIMTLVTATVLIWWHSIGDGLAGGLILASLMIPLVSLRQIQEARLRGIGQLFESQIGTAIWPWVLSLLAAIAWGMSAAGVTSWLGVALHLISVSIISVMVFLFCRKTSLFFEQPSTDGTSPRQWRSQRRQRRAMEMQHAARESSRQRWKQTALAFLFAEILIVLKSRACVVLAGIFLDKESVGIYGAMEKFADVSVLATQSLGLVIAPQFAALHAAGRFPEMRRLMKQGQFLGLCTTLPVAVAVALFGDRLLVLLGPGYREGWSVLIALLASACIAAFSGPAAYVLQMTGHERTMLMITVVSAATNILLSLLLMRSYGLLGLGFAQMAASLVWMMCVRWSLAVHPAWQPGAQEDSASPHHVHSEVTL